MHFNTLTNTNMIIYQNQFPIAFSSSVHLGFMSVLLNDTTLECPVGTPLEVEFIDKHYRYINIERVPMIIKGTGTIGTSLRLDDDDKDKVNKWKKFLTGVRTRMVKYVH